MPKVFETTLEINLPALKHNFEVLKAKLNTEHPFFSSRESFCIRK